MVHDSMRSRATAECSNSIETWADEEAETEENKYQGRPYRYRFSGDLREAVFDSEMKICLASKGYRWIRSVCIYSLKTLK